MKSVAHRNGSETETLADPGASNAFVDARTFQGDPPSLIRERAKQALVRHLESIESIAADTKLPAPERLRAIEIHTRLAGVDTKPPEHGEKHGPRHEEAHRPQHGPKHSA